MKKKLKKYYKYIVACLVIIVLCFTWNYRVNKVEKTLEDQLAKKESIIEEKEKEIQSLNLEIERQKMIASEWYEMWESERQSSEWLYDFYYSNVCSIYEDECDSGVYE